MGAGFSTKMKGAYYFFTAGTGILPVLDLFDALLRKYMYQVMKSQCSHFDTVAVNPFQDDLEGLVDNEVSLTLFASFAKAEEFLGADIVINLVKFSQMVSKGGVKAYLRLKDGAKIAGLESVSRKFDSSTLKTRIPNNGRRYFVCGSPTFNVEVPNSLAEIGVPVDKIELL